MRGRRVNVGQVPKGVQPERDGLIICLLCDAGFRWLDPHLRQTHGVTTEEYKDQFELPKRGLLNESGRQKRREHALHLLATDERVRNGILRKDPAQERRWLKRARKAAAAASTKAGVQEILRNNARHAGAVAAQRRRDAHERRAQELGYESLAVLVKASIYLSNPELAQLLGCSASRASKIRRGYGAASRSQAFQRVAGDAHRREARLRAFEQQLVELGPAAQPRDESGRWVCRVCSQPADYLAAHALDAHQLSPARYMKRATMRRQLDQKAQTASYHDVTDLFRRTLLDSRDDVAAMLGCSRRNLANIHQCFPDLPTRSAGDVKAARSLAATRAQSGKRQRARANYDELARRCGYPDIKAMIASTLQLTYQQIAAMLGVPSHRVQFLRQRYGPTA